MGIQGKSDLVVLPFDTQLAIYLIKEELKSRRFFRTLQEMGLNDCYFQPHLDTLILSCLDMDDDNDATFDVYYEIMERRCLQIQADHESVLNQAWHVYHELLAIRQQQTIVVKEQ